MCVYLFHPSSLHLSRCVAVLLPKTNRQLHILNTSKSALALPFILHSLHTSSLSLSHLQETHLCCLSLARWKIPGHWRGLCSKSLFIRQLHTNTHTHTMPVWAPAQCTGMECGQLTQPHFRAQGSQVWCPMYGEGRTHELFINHTVFVCVLCRHLVLQ